ncbi:hypothetical protein G6F46_005039 [Rhizopus delemar]|uniref:Myosin motor domain-containing protein n=2 Tax=Rhizopus TaxID=4842 RepID=A0A9P6Z3R3_9FUNG|nr:hypothetical protein G6F55_004571 [Rhizopus delemar]KAG1544233.1 hypothetical protein G6F51_006189 [Rhizopus arrhizus]KAG1499427.1 hypothetical protein G6F54_004416 [Rhizopus delemar]KAG1513198.1 hypothetical protein G6F53_004614 [Rhizopus delemar]KAG1525138.1 hypothetical protein G6F52_003592 [Rhizopus delemar]
MFTTVKDNQEYGGSFIHSYGSKKFVRPKLDNVLDAVAQARFNEKKWVWVEDDHEGYVRAHILNEDKDKIEIEYESGAIAFVNNSKLKAMNPPKFDMVDDMAELTHLNEPSVIHNLTVRYKAHHVYTYSGLFLVAVNPYRNLLIYTDEYIQSYKVVASIDKHLNELQNQILQANPILEAFGNAQTIRNNNSSRFGKFIRIEFNSRAQICGANIEWYLLEKSRVHYQTPKERNYHIFYQLLEADEDIKKLLLLDGTADDYNFLKQSNKRIDGVDDREEYLNLVKALDIMGLSEKEKLDLFKIVAAILHLGNISITSYLDRADIKNFDMVERACHLLGISAEGFKKSLLAPRIKAGKDWVTQAKSPAQVIASIDALAKTLYERNFGFLVERINKAIDGPNAKEKAGFIGVLDIAGFEIFEASTNSFEQLCINYTNEKLQQFFNQNMFELEQEEYRKEKINWDYIDFGKDLQPTIDLIEKINPVGILSCLEEECVAPRGSDQRFLQKLNKFCNNDDPDAKYKTTRFQDGFILKHYAGDVEYSVNGWIEKNKYPLNEDITRLLARSSQKHTAKLFEEYEEENNDRTHNHSTSSFVSMLKVRKGSGSFGTVGQRHKQQLSTLMSTLYVTHPHFVRCILPNDKKRPGEIQTKLVLDQLRCNGVLEGIRICRKGFPNRLSFDEFRKRYGILCPNLLNRESFIDGRTACQLLLDQLNLDKERYQIGMTKVFFKATVLAELEEQRDNKLGVCITQFQAHCRARLARQFQTRFSRQADAIRVMQRNARIYISLREWPWWKVYAKLKPLNAAYRVDIQMQERDQKIHTLEAQLKDQSSTANEMASRNQELENQQVELKQLILDEQSIIRELEESKQELFQKFTMAEERIEELESELNQKSKTMEENQKNLEQKADQANLELFQQLEENKTLKERLAVLEKENKDIKASLKEKQYQFDKETIEKNGKIQQLELDYKNKIDILNTEIEELKEQLNEVKSQSARDNKQNHETTVQLESEINELKQALNNETDTRNDLQTKYDCLKEDWDNLTALVKAESDQAKSRISRFDQVLNDLKAIPSS